MAMFSFVFVHRSFISANMGAQFVAPPALDFELILRDSSEFTPIVFVLSAGSDPSEVLIRSKRVVCVKLTLLLGRFLGCRDVSQQSKRFFGAS